MTRYAVAILSGALLAWYGNELPDPLWSAYLPILLLLGYLRPPYRCLCIAAAAWLWSAAMFHQHLEHRLDLSYDNRVTLLRGVVADIPVFLPGRLRVELRDVEIEGYPGPAPRRVRLNWYRGEVEPRPGERWRFEVKLRQPRGLRNPAGFDYASWLFAQGIDALGYIRDSARNRRLRPAGLFELNGWRARLADRIDSACAECEHAGLIKALALGFRGAIPAPQRDLLQRSATAHLLAISGLHIGLAALLGFAAGRAGWRVALYRAGIGRSAPAAAGAILAAGGYAALAGFSLPTLRALLMLLVVLAALTLRRRIDLLHALALAVAAIVIADPRAVATGSFWLSAGAVLVIAYFRFRWPRDLPRWRSLLALQTCFALLFAPAGLLLFGYLNPAGLPANLVAIPLISILVLPAILLACGLAVAGLPGSATLFALADAALGLLLDWLRLLLDSGLDAVPLSYPALVVAGLLAAVLWLSLPRGLPLRHGAALAGLLLLAWQPSKPRHGEFEMVVLDVGMGTSVLLQTRHHSLVYDFGPGRPGQFSAGSAALMPLLRSRRIGLPDLAVVSHVDQDHSGGLHVLLEREAELPLLSGTPRELAARFDLRSAVRSCHGYPAWRWDGVEFEFLAAAAETASSNNRSCVLRVAGHQRVLLPGDIEAKVETRLASAQASALAAEVLLAPHHGSGTSSSALFLDRVAPRLAIFTLSRGNRWGFPAAAVVERYEARAIGLLRSDRDGAISLRSAADGMHVDTAREAPARFWLRW